MKTLTIDGNTAAAMSAYATNEMAIIYPITPSSPMAESCDKWSGENKPTMFGTPMQVVEMQSEAGVAGAVHGSLVSGVLTTTFTASQGLLLMIPNMYKIAGELLPCVFHVTARTLATHALSIFGDHSDVMACRQTGWGMLCSNNVQETHDFATIAQMATLNSRVPFIHFFDGFRTSHEIAKINALETGEIEKLMPKKAIEEFRSRALSPAHPHQQGTAQNPDVFFQNREACNPYYNEAFSYVVKAMSDFAKATGRKYSPYEYYGSPTATKVIVMMGSGAETVQQTIDKIKDPSVGLLKVRVYRPWSAENFVKSLPETVKFITVLDKTKESGSVGEPLYTDVITSLAEEGRKIKVLGGRYGLASKDFTPAMALAVIENTKTGGKNHFTVGIEDDVTHTSLKIKAFDIDYSGKECLFYGLGSDGTVSANKNSIKIIGDLTDLYAQGYFEYDSKKSGTVTISHLRFGKEPILAHFSVEQADFIACHNERFIGKYDLLKQLKPNGIFLLNCEWTPEELEEKLPADFKRTVYKNKIKFYTVNGTEIAHKLGLKGKINTIMQSAFFYLTNIVDFEKAKDKMKQLAEKSYGKAGQTVIENNFKAIDESPSHLVQVKVPADWATAKNKVDTKYTNETSKFNEQIILPVTQRKGDDLPCSVFTADGRVPTDTTRFEKRGIADSIPVWLSENCIQCNMCSFICPHGAIKPVLIDKKTKRPTAFTTIKAMATDKYDFRIQISPLDCTGCGNCVNICPAQKKALAMADAEQQIAEQKANYEFASKLDNDTSVFGINTIKGSQFAPCYFQFSGACAGCGETPYIKLATQLFGENMVIANATGCSSIYGGSYPTCPYAKNSSGRGPAWANSLFEDNAEFGFGMKLANKMETDKLTGLVQTAIEQKSKNKAVLKKWLETLNDYTENNIAVAEIISKLPDEIKTASEPLKGTLTQILALKEFLTQKSVWIIGGDGWAYDIGFGGLDHVLSGNEDVNILVLDTQVYSNTGGQSSKATPLGATAKFAESGKRTGKKNLALMALNYPNAYVAQVAMGANMMQCLTAMREAQQHKGPSLIVAYSTCINQGIDMSNSMGEMKKAVQSGYWHLFRYLPEQQELKIDSPAPTASYYDFVANERRYAALIQKDPEGAKKLIEQAKEENDLVLKKLTALAGMNRDAKK